MTADVPVLIIGGGIGGMSAALALARAGFAAHIVERSREFGEIGAGIQLAPNALRILDGLGVLPELAALAVHPRRLVLMHADTGRHLTTVDFGEPFKRRYGYAYTVMHRGDLLTVLHQACQADDRITLESNREVTELADHGGTALVRFADGGSYECGAVVGADGLWSTARKLVSDDRPRHRRVRRLPRHAAGQRHGAAREQGQHPGRAGRRDHLDRAAQAPGSVPDPPRRAVQPGRRVPQLALLAPRPS